MRREPFEIDEKRFYMPFPETKCPACGAKSEPSCEYLSYFKTNTPFDLEFRCSNDDCPEANTADYEPYYFTKRVEVVCYMEIQ